MVTAYLPFLMYMLLGRSIDLQNYQIGGDVFDNREYDETNINSIKTTYAVLPDNAYLYTFMGFPVDLVLRVKAGHISLTSDKSLDNLVRGTTWKQKSVVVIVGTTVHTVRRSLKVDAEPLPNWTTRIAPTQTHYANALLYGGFAFFLFRFQCDIPGDVETVRKTLMDVLGQYGNFEPSIEKRWQEALNAVSKNEEIRGEVTVHVHAHSTFPFQHNLTSFTGLLNAIKEVPKLVGPVGKPIGMELLPLYALDPKYPEVEETHDLDKRLEEINDMYDDVKNTKNRINRWMESTLTLFSEEDETKIAELMAHLSACFKLLYGIASEASVYKHMDPEILETAADLYNRNLTYYSYSYDRIFRKLKEDIDAECEDDFHHKIKGLLQVKDSERIKVGEVEGGLEECKSACLAVPKCRSIGYVDQMMFVKKGKKNYELTVKNKICYVYFRSSSTADVMPPTEASTTAVYDRKCY
nr:venom protein [Lampona murina]